uniref:Uncharacterized protein n=1 Tax=Setaria viridis TaxID=4556 RepID=A0A4U6UWA1_SETVI|nr:hypothetical protein SEVIR_4G041901v2 [Setaria viridis]
MLGARATEGLRKKVFFLLFSSSRDSRDSIRSYLPDAAPPPLPTRLPSPTPRRLHPRRRAASPPDSAPSPTPRCLPSRIASISGRRAAASVPWPLPPPPSSTSSVAPPPLPAAGSLPNAWRLGFPSVSPRIASTSRSAAPPPPGLALPRGRQIYTAASRWTSPPPQAAPCCGVLLTAFSVIRVCRKWRAPCRPSRPWEAFRSEFD